MEEKIQSIGTVFDLKNARRVLTFVHFRHGDGVVRRSCLVLNVKMYN